MDKQTKQHFISELKSLAESSAICITVSQNGLDAAENSDLRAKAFAEQVNYRIVKNTLAKIALRETHAASLEQSFVGVTAFVSSKDPVAAAKFIVDYAKGNDKIVVKAGALNGEALSAKQVETLAKLPSMDQLRGKLIGVIQAPATKIAGVLQAPAGQIARVISAYASK